LDVQPAATLVVLQYRVPEGSGLVDGTDLNAEQLSRAWAVAVGASGREAVRDVRKEQLNGMHTGVQATLVESVGPGDTSEVRVALTVAHGQILVLGYEASAGSELEKSETWRKILRGLVVVLPGRNWGLYIKYGLIVGVGLMGLLGAWWLVLRPRGGELWPGRTSKANTHIRSADGLGQFEPAPEVRPPEPSFLQKRPLTNPLDEDPFEPAAEVEVEPLAVPTVGVDWDPENDPAFAVPDAPTRPQVGFGTPSAPAGRGLLEQGGDSEISSNLDALFGEEPA